MTKGANGAGGPDTPTVARGPDGKYAKWKTAEQKRKTKAAREARYRRRKWEKMSREEKRQRYAAWRARIVTPETQHLSDTMANYQHIRRVVLNALQQLVEEQYIPAFRFKNAWVRVKFPLDGVTALEILLR